MSIMNLSSSRMIQHSLPRRLLPTTPAWSASRYFRLLLRGVSLITSNFSLPAPTGSSIIRQSARC